MGRFFSSLGLRLKLKKLSSSSQFSTTTYRSDANSPDVVGSIDVFRWYLARRKVAAASLSSTWLAAAGVAVVRPLSMKFSSVVSARFSPLLSSGMESIRLVRRRLGLDTPTLGSNP